MIIEEITKYIIELHGKYNICWSVTYNDSEFCEITFDNIHLIHIYSSNIVFYFDVTRQQDNHVKEQIQISDPALFSKINDTLKNFKEGMYDYRSY